VLVLIQRGKGGGLAGAFGGLGGQSAFGTKAGDLFTRITIGVAALWIILCLVTVKLSGVGESLLESNMGGGGTATEGGVNPGSPSKPAEAGGESKPAAPKTPDTPKGKS
jgi:preprotein translocase subunit SecG